MSSFTGRTGENGTTLFLKSWLNRETYPHGGSCAKIGRVDRQLQTAECFGKGNSRRMFTIEIEIDRPSEVVFGYLAQVENTQKWYSAVEKADKLTSAPVSAGTCYRFLRRLPTGPAINDVEVTEFVPNSVFTLASRSGPKPFTYRFRLSPQGKNTQLRLEGEISGEGLGRGFALVAPFAERLFERGMRANLATLKQILELSGAQ